MKIKNYILLCVATLLLTGCNDAFLERTPQAINDPTFWNTTADLKTYANQFYNSLGGGLNSMADGESDNQVPNSKPSFFWNEQTTPATGGLWGKSDWQPIRNLNYFMTHYQKAQGVESEINQYVAEVRFFRALQYGAKMRQFGDVPWVGKDLGVADTDILFGPKLKRDLLMAKIVEDFDFAIKWLPDTPEKGRINKNVARHLKARTCLHEATYYKYHTALGLSSKANALLEQAVEAANAIMTSGKQEIYNTGKPAQDYYDLFLIEDKATLKEAILPVEYKDGLKMHGISRSIYEANNGFSKDFVKSFLCTDGKPIAISNLYQGDKTTIDAEFTNRDPRLAQTILTPRFPRNISLTGEITYIKEPELVNKNCYTGYNIIKFFSPTAKAFEPASSTYGGIVYRYAETLLIYAEAKAELGTVTQADLDKSINLLRNRVGMPHLTTAVGFEDPNWTQWGYNLSPLLQEIRRERRIELGGEGLRFDDICRWKAGEICNNKDTYTGKWVQASTATDGTVTPAHYAQVYEGFVRTWNDKLYLRPIPTDELTRNKQLLPQNPGWDTIKP